MAGKAWGPVVTAIPQSFEDIMSEELALQIMEEENTKEALYDVAASAIKSEETACASKVIQHDQCCETLDSVDSDILLALKLQNEFDQEYDEELKREERFVNGNSKVCISFDNYRKSHQQQQQHKEEEEIEEAEIEVKMPTFGKGGLAGKGKAAISKHDLRLSGTMNTEKMLNDFPADFPVGDGFKKEFRLPNKVYNQLKQHSQSSSKKMARIHEAKDHSTADMAIDQRTRLIMFKIINKGILNAIHGVISGGKESVVFYAEGGCMDDSIVPNECALKVFKTTLTDFKRRSQYVKGDVRFFPDEFQKQNPRRIMKIWAKKEMCNLRRIEKHGIPCPRTVVLKNHVLIMEFIGKNGQAAPKLKHSQLNKAESIMAYEQTLAGMRDLYKKCSLVHADLNEYNLLWHNDHVVFIDVSQSVEIFHPNAHSFLLRDCQNISQFFSGLGVPNVMDKYDLFNWVTDLNLTGRDEEFLSQLQEYEKNEVKVRDGCSEKNYQFNYFLEKSQNQIDISNEEDSEDSEEDLDYNEEQPEPKLMVKTN